MPKNMLRAGLYGALIWLIGFLVGSVVFAIPQLQALEPIAYVTFNPAISVPILIVWFFVIGYFARTYFKKLAGPIPKGEGLRIGLTFAAVCILLDVFVMVYLIGNGFGFFAYAALWAGYGICVYLPVRIEANTRGSDGS